VKISPELILQCNDPVQFLKISEEFNKQTGTSLEMILSSDVAPVQDLSQKYDPQYDDSIKSLTFEDLMKMNQQQC